MAESFLTVSTSLHCTHSESAHFLFYPACWLEDGRTFSDCEYSLSTAHTQNLLIFYSIQHVGWRMAEPFLTVSTSLHCTHSESAHFLFYPACWLEDGRTFSDCEYSLSTAHTQNLLIFYSIQHVGWRMAETFLTVSPSLHCTHSESAHFLFYPACWLEDGRTFSDCEYLSPLHTLRICSFFILSSMLAGTSLQDGRTFSDCEYSLSTAHTQNLLIFYSIQHVGCAHTQYSLSTAHTQNLLIFYSIQHVGWRMAEPFLTVSTLSPLHTLNLLIFYSIQHVGWRMAEPFLTESTLSPLHTLRICSFFILSSMLAGGWQNLF
jgi:hypothetical protein